MRVCPRCRARYPTAERFCERDSSVLVEDIDIARIGTTVGNYHLDRILGRGGMGTVYSGEHVYIHRKVAVKILHAQFARFEEAVNRFLREARAATSINHPNIVDVTDFGPMPDGGVYFVMEYLDGASLEDIIEHEGSLPLHRSLNIANQIGLALAAAHDTGIIHRDLKPDNIMLIRMPGRRDVVRTLAGAPVDEDAPTDRFVVEREEVYDFVKVLDFGIAKVLRQDDLGEDDVRGAIFGTPEYMSPEAARGEDVDHRSDIYSLGVILFDMICGRPPFEAEAANDVLNMHIYEEPPRLADVAPDVEVTDAAEQLLAHALQKDPARRHQHMDEFRLELQQCYGSVSFRRNADVPGMPPRGPESRARRLTEELDEWLRSDQSAMSLEEARSMAMLQRDDAFPTDDEDHLADALDRALDDDERR